MTNHVRRRVVVTGIGAVTPLGSTMVETWQNLVNGKSGVVSLEQALRQQGRSDEFFQHEWNIAKSLPCQVAAPVHNFNQTPDPASLSFKVAQTSRFVQFALTAAVEAVESAGLSDWWKDEEDELDDDPHSTSYSERRRQATGVSIGTGMSGVREIADAVRLMDPGSTGSKTEARRSGYRALSPHFVPKVLGNSAAARISLWYGLRGPNLSAATACAAGSHAIGDAARLIQYGGGNHLYGRLPDDPHPPTIDIMLAGGSESCLDPLSLAGFAKLRALSTAYNDDPTSASRPFDSKRDGFVMGEGACVMVLEEMEHARKRLKSLPLSSQPAFLIELVGYGATADAYHITSPDPQGKGAVEAMQLALRDANLTSHQSILGYVNAHATSTPMGDEIEMKAIHRALIGDTKNPNEALRREQPPISVSSTKGATGHLLGAAGAIEAAISVQSLIHQVIPATRNLDQLARDDLHGLSFVRGSAVTLPPTEELNVAMSNSFGFGGTNSSLVFRRISFEEGNPL